MATPSSTAPPLPADETARLTDFARACKAAARIVSLYPATHPAIRSGLDRVEQASAAVMQGRPYVIAVLPDTLLVGGRPPLKPDAAIADLALLLRGHLVDELTLVAPMDTSRWHAFLLLLARPPEEVRVEGGFVRAWQDAGGGPIEVRQIDYAEVLREKDGGLDASWDRRIASFLDDEPAELSQDVLAELLALADDPARLAALADRVRGTADEASPEGGRRSALLARMFQALAEHVSRTAPERLEGVLRNITAVTPHLDAGTVLTLTGDAATSGHGGGATSAIDLGREIRERLEPEAAARFVMNSVARSKGATARLVEAFQALVPDTEQRHHVLGMAAQLASSLGAGKSPDFSKLWETAAAMMSEYSDEAYVSEEYDRELSSARAHAVDVERIADDPPDRIDAWLSTVSDEQVRRLDQMLLRDLLRIEARPDAWRLVLDVTVHLIEQLVLVGDLPLALELLDTLVEIRHRPELPFHDEAADGLSRLQTETLMRHVVLFIRQADDSEVAQATRFCRTLGPSVMRPLAEALAVEENSRALRRLSEVLLGFGAAGRAYTNELRRSANPAVRRTAVELLRAFGGDDALSDLLPLLDDADVQVQREALRAIARLGTNEAYVALRRQLTSGSDGARQAILQSASWLRDERAAPIFAHILRHQDHRGAHEATYRQAIEAIGVAGTRSAEALDALKMVLYRGEWWAPRRTARLRLAAAMALRACGTSEADFVLTEAGLRAPRGARRAAAAALAQPAPSKGAP